MSESKEINKKSSEQLRTEQRLRKKWAFKFLFEQGKFARGNFFSFGLIWTQQKNLLVAGPKIGLVVGKKRTHGPMYVIFGSGE